MHMIGKFGLIQFLLSLEKSAGCYNLYSSDDRKIWLWMYGIIDIKSATAPMILMVFINPGSLTLYDPWDGGGLSQNAKHLKEVNNRLVEQVPWILICKLYTYFPISYSYIDLASLLAKTLQRTFSNINPRFRDLGRHGPMG